MRVGVFRNNGKRTMSDTTTRLIKQVIKLLDGATTAIQNYTDTIRKQPEANKHSKDPQQFTVIKSEISLPPAICAYYETEQNERPNKARWKRMERTVEFTGIALLAIYTFYTIKMYHANREAADAAKSAADAGIAAVEASRAASRLDQRAWIGTEGYSAVINAGVPANVTIAFRNTGKTPALQFRSSVNTSPEPKGLYPDFNRLAEPKSKGVLPPNGVNTVSVSPTKGAKLAQSEYEKVRSGELVVFIYGTAWYEDIFGQPHWIHFCSYVGRDGTSVQICDTHNEVDREPEKPVTERHRNTN